MKRAYSRRVATLVAVAVATALPIGAAHAGGLGHEGSVHEDTDSSGAADGKTISASAGAVTFDHSDNGKGSSVGPITPSGTWTPPPCWYAPTYTPEEFKAERESVWQQPSTGHQWELAQRERYVEGEPYKNFNLKKSGEGYWWTSFTKLNAPLGSDTCDEPTFWVDNGEPPPADIPNTITPETLAELAYAEIRVPETTVELSPTDTQTVSLPTWVWLDQATFKPVSVTAAVELLDISATTTATPVSLHIEPGTEDAKLHPSSGECAINDDGSIGTPYTKGNLDKAPPCGLTYFRSSGDGTYPLQASLTWEVSWKGSNGETGTLPNGTFESTKAITVQEIQSIVR